MYTKEVGDVICAGLAEGQSLRSVCAAEGMPSPSTVLRWVDADKDFAEQYARARELGYQLLADQILDISDEESVTVRYPKAGAGEDADAEVVFDATAVARNRLRVDSRKWMLSKMLPKVYGDKLTQEHTGPNGGPVQVASVAIELVKPKT